MKKKKKFIFFSLTILCVLFFLGLVENNKTLNKIKSFVSSENRQFIKKYLFPYKYINQKNLEISQMKINMISEDEVIAKLELNFKNSADDIQIKKKL